jgi:hypothetical protein
VERGGCGILSGGLEIFVRASDGYFLKLRMDNFIALI